MAKEILDNLAEQVAEERCLDFLTSEKGAIMGSLPSVKNHDWLEQREF